jgi:hypothetical protein
VKCEKHDWDWDIGDPTGCPVCYGESLERDRITTLLEEHRDKMASITTTGYGPSSANPSVRVKTIDALIYIISQQV